MMEADSSVKGKNMTGLLFSKKKCFEAGSQGVPRGFLFGRKKKIIQCRGTKDRKGKGTNSGESGTRNLETKSIRRRAESKGGCVKLDIVTAKRQSSKHDTFIAQRVFILYSVLCRN